MARTLTLYARNDTARLQDPQGQALSPAALVLFLGETLTLNVYIRDASNVAVNLTGNTSGWNLALKSPADLDGTTLLAAKASASVTAATGLVVFELSGNDLNSSALATYLADPLAPANYGKPVALEVYTMPASDKIVYAAGTATAARSAYRPGDPAPLNAPTIAYAFGTGSDGALAYTSAGGWTLAGAAMTTSANNWTVSGAALTLLRSLDCTTGSIAAGGTLQGGAHNTARWPELRFTGMIANAGTIAANLLGIDDTGAVMATPGAGRNTTGTGNAPDRQSNSALSHTGAGGSGAGGGTASNLGGGRHTPVGPTYWFAPRVAGGSTNTGTTGAGANGTDRSAPTYSLDPDLVTPMPGHPGTAGGGGGVTVGTGTGTSGAGGTGGRGAGVLTIRAWGISNSGTISANGESGSNGGDATTTGNGQAGGGGGGSGGGGGQIRIYYGAGGYSNTGTVSATAGAAGTGGLGSASGSPEPLSNGGNGGASGNGLVLAKRVA
jgi:hypothetical protein